MKIEVRHRGRGRLPGSGGKFKAAQALFLISVEYLSMDADAAGSPVYTVMSLIEL